MNIGIDIDGVLTNMERELLDYATKMCVEEEWSINVKQDEYDEEKAFNWTEEQGEKFWNKYLIKYFTQTPIRKFAPEVIEKLKEEGNKIYIITARNNYGMPKKYNGKVQKITKKWLKNNKIKYDEIIFEGNKLQPCIDNNIDVMIEDSPDNITELSSKIKVIKFDCQYNKEINNENVITAYSWYHIYRIIKEMKGE